MRLKIILLVLAAVGCLAVVGFLGSREETPDASKQRSYHPDFPFDLLGKAALLWPGATAKVISQPITVLPGQPRTIQVKPSSEIRVARLALRSGRAASVTYFCGADGCQRDTCLVVKGEARPPGCNDDPDDVRGFALERSGGSIRIEALLNEAVQIESR
jgi:hypothetical protein